MTNFTILVLRRAGGRLVIAERELDSPAFSDEIPHLSAENSPESRRALAEIMPLLQTTIPTPVQSFVEKSAARDGISKMQVKRRLEKQLGLGSRVLDRWETAGIPSTGNKRNVVAIEALEALMGAG